MPTVVDVPGVGNVEFPDGMSDDQIAAVIKKQSAPATSEKPEQPFSFLDTAKGVATGVAKGAGSTLLGAYDLARTVAAKTDPFSAMAGAGPALPPPPAWMTEGVEAKSTAESVGKGVEQIAEFFLPAGLIAKGAKAVEAMKAPRLVKALARPAMEAAGAGTVAAVQSGGKPEEVAKAAGTAGLVSAFMPPGAAAAKKIYESAKQSYARALRATTKPMKKTAEKIVPELLERRVSALTLGGLEEKAQMELAKAGQQLDEALDLMSKNPSAPRIATKPIVDALETYKGGFIVDGVPINEKAVQTIEGIQKTINDLGADVSFESMRRVRQILDNKVAWRKGFVMPLEEGTAIDATKEAAHAIRRELADAAPDIAKINKEYSFWKRVDEVVGETIERTRPQAPRLGERIMAAAGAAGGFTKGGVGGAAIGATAMRGLTKLINSTAWNTISAVNKARLADLLASGKFEQANSFMARAAAGLVTSREGKPPAELPPPPH